MLVMLALLGLLFCGSINESPVMNYTSKDIIIINGEIILCRVCKKPACYVHLEDDELVAYCKKHMPLPEK